MHQAGLERRAGERAELADTIASETNEIGI